MAKSILKHTLIVGLIIGTIMAINMVYMVGVCYNDDKNFEPSAVWGYTAMIVVFSLMFVGIRNYRNKVNDGYITFGKALKMGSLMTLIGGSIYVIVWLIYYYGFVPDFLDHYIPFALEQAAKDGATAAELATQAADMADFKEMYKNPLFVILITYSEVLPVGLIVALISALILKRKPKAAVVA
jgi:hypothetical protein